ncbi:uncharacterized protein N7498_005734 [Penicillium cinerascens]|uniref:DUF7702 domain-containing protein n=1 Tax=Penicillium cinerascens TaxID=70096 RepID=A0A9W9MP02_9EURO|nr:uncharacterized protein N7498_005734 [Penicillium cinerascens]KAJ5204855.1 hypothetical protein N7498_005734 [Penicillium cinerascens]
MTLSYHHAISVLQLIIYLPSIFLAAFLVYRHGLRTNSGFIFLTTFSLTRVVGACCDLASISNPSTGLFTAAAICSAVGLSPLMLACVGLLSRANLSIQHTTSRPALPSTAFSLFRILTVVAMAISIAGITANMSAEGLAHPDIKTKVGMILYLVSWAAMVLILLVVTSRRSSLERGEHRTLLAVAISSPFILVRVIYATLIWFLHNGTFSILNGNETVILVMSVLEEFVVVIVCLGVGMTLRVRSTQGSRSKGEEAAMPDYPSKPLDVTDS